MHILIVEDDKSIALTLRKELEAENHRVSVASDGYEALEYASSDEFDVVVLELTLPGIDGFEVTRRLRKKQDHTPILMLTSRDAVPDVVKGLDSGGDDYLTKPFSFDVLLARLRSVARRGTVPRPSCLRVADLILNPATHEVFRGKDEIQLSLTEYRLLEFLMRRADRIVSRNALVHAVWNHEQDIESNTLDAFIRLLRSKVDRGQKKRLIQTVRGAGYMIRSHPKI